MHSTKHHVFILKFNVIKSEHSTSKGWNAHCSWSRSKEEPHARASSAFGIQAAIVNCTTFLAFCAS